MFSPPHPPPQCHLKCSLFLSDGQQLRVSTFPWRPAIVTMVSGQYWRPLCHPCTPVIQRWRGHSEHTDTLHWGEHECMDLLSVEGVRAFLLRGLSLHGPVCVCVWVCAHFGCATVSVCVLTQSASWVCSQFTFDCRAKARARNEFWLSERLT